MPTEQEYVNYKDFVESLDSVNPSANDKAVLNVGGAGPKSSVFSAIAAFVHNAWAAFLNACTAITSFASGDMFSVSNPTDGTRKMSKDVLLELTAQNALAGNVAQAFDPTKPNDDGGYAYYAGEKVTYRGVTYEFIVNHASGPWNSVQVVRYTAEKEIPPNDYIMESDFAKDEVIVGMLKTDGTFDTSVTSNRGLKKIPFFSGDVVELRNAVEVQGDSNANVVIYNASGSVTEYFTTSNFFRKFSTNGYISLCWGASQKSSDVFRFSPFDIKTTLFYKRALTFKGYSEKTRDYMYRVYGALKSDGTISSYSENFITLYKIPVKTGYVFDVGNSGSFGSGFATLVLYNSEGVVQYSHASSTYKYTVPSDGYVSISYRLSQTNFYCTVKDGDGVYEIDDVVSCEKKNEDLQKDFCRKILSKCYKKGAFKQDGTFVPLPQSTWKAIDRFPLRKNGILITRNLATNIVSGYASYVVIDRSGNILNYGVASSFFIEAVEDCFVCLAGTSDFTVEDVYVKNTDYYSYIEYVDNLFTQAQDAEKKTILGNIAQVFKRCTFVGDSITCGFINSDGVHVDSETAKALKQNWAEYMCVGRGMACTNVAVGGSSTHNWRYGGFAGGVTVDINVADVDTDAYFVALGVNDKRIPLTLGSSDDIESDYTENADTMYGNYDYIVRKLHSFNPNAKIFVMTTGSNESGMNTWNEAVRYIASLYDYVYLIDLWNEEFFSSDLCSSYMWKNGHFTPIGERVLAEVVWKLLNSIVLDNIADLTYSPYYAGM